MQSRKLPIPAVIAVAISAATAASALAQPIPQPEPIQLQSFRTHSRLTLAIDDGIGAEWKNTTQGFELLLKGATLADLGAVLGEEDEWKQKFARVRDNRVQGLSFEETRAGLVIRAPWKYPTGPTAPAKPEMEAFEYRTNEPSRYVVDFWVKDGLTVADLAILKMKQVHQAEVRRIQNIEHTKVVRRIASEKKRQRITELGRFCNKPLSEDTDVFMKFKPVHTPVDFKRWLPSTSPDAQYEYKQPSGGGEDAQYGRLAFQLFEQGKYALALRSLDFMEASHPSSPLLIDLRLLRAASLVKLGHGKLADDVIKRVMEDSLHSTQKQPALHAAMYRALKQMEAGEHFQALETFSWLENRYPSFSKAWVFHFGAAEALYALRQSDRAVKEYQVVIETAPTKALKAEAAIRAGDVYMDRLQFEQALASYFQGVSYFPEEAKTFPSIFLNRAETLYQLGQMDRAKDAFDYFLAQYPAHSEGWRATFRLGEIEGRKQAQSAEARKWFTETANRYPFSPGATLARIRLIPCGDHAGFDFEGMERFFDTDARKFDFPAQVVMADFGDLRALTRARAIMNLGREEVTVESGLKELAAVKQAKVKREVATIVNDALRKRLIDLLDDGRGFEAVALYRRRAKLIPADDSGIEPEHLIRLSQVAANQGLGQVAREIAEDYEKGVKLARRYQSAQQGRAVASAAGGGGEVINDPDTAMRTWEEQFTHAKALFVSSGGKPKASSPEALQIRKALENVREASRYSFEKELMLSQMEAQEGRMKEALSHASQAQILAPQVSGGHPRLDAWIASLHESLGSQDVAAQLYRALAEGTAAAREPAAANDLATPEAVLGYPPALTREKARLSEAQLLEKLGKWGEAATAYSDAAARSDTPTRAIFAQARALFKTGTKGDRAKGQELLRKLASLKPGKKAEKPDFWIRLADEMLTNEENRKAVKPNESAE